MGADPRTGRIVFDKSAEGRAKTGVAVIGTLSKFGDWIVRRYLAELGVEHAPDLILFRMRGGSPYGEFAPRRRLCGRAPGERPR